MFHELNEINSMEKEKKSELKELAAKNFSVWNQSLLSRDAHEVASLYDQDASFLPTLNSGFKHGQDGAEKYFKHFLEKNPAGKIIEEAIQETSVNKNGNISSFLHSGMYNFEIGEQNNRQIVEARFTFLWQKDEAGDWKIKHHHSSLKPLEK